MEEDDTWAQTRINVTPEDDAVIRQYSESTAVSGTPDTPIAVEPRSVIFRRSFSSTNGHYVSPDESFVKSDVAIETEDTGTKDAEIQTCLEGIRTIKILVDCKDEAAQTMYMSAPCPPLRYYKDIMSTRISYQFQTKLSCCVK